jgi:hypothetical protein
VLAVNHDISAVLEPDVNTNTRGKACARFVSVWQSPHGDVEECSTNPLQVSIDEGRIGGLTGHNGLGSANGGLHYQDDGSGAVMNRCLVFCRAGHLVIPMTENVHAILERLENSTGYLLPPLPAIGNDMNIRRFSRVE